MSAKPNRFRVVRGNARATVFAWTHPATGKRCWRFGVRDGAGKWRWVTRSTREKAREAAWERLGEAREDLPYSELPAARRAFLRDVEALVAPGLEEDALRALSSLASASTLAEAAVRYIAHKTAAAGRETQHIANMRRDLESLSSSLGERRIAAVAADDLSAWIDERCPGCGPTRRRGVRTTLVGLWRWARREAIVPNDAVTAAERLPAVPRSPGGLRILSPGELLAVLAGVRPEFRAWVVLGAFAGLRPWEVSPDPKWGKPGLRWEHIDWDFRAIRVPAQVAKTGRARIVPVTEALSAWLDWSGVRTSGPVCPLSMSSARETRRLAGLIGLGRWPKDCLRHTYGSMRNALLRDLPRIAEEMGTSVEMLHRHYHNPRPRADGETWESLRPPDLSGLNVPICSDLNEVQAAILRLDEKLLEEKPRETKQNAELRSSVERFRI